MTESNQSMFPDHVVDDEYVVVPFQNVQSPLPTDEYEI